MVANLDATTHESLRKDLRSSLREAHQTGRPVLTHLNADSSWLLSLPYPSGAPSKRARYNIIIDPWLRGTQSDVASWFSSQTHVIPSAVQSVVEIDHDLADIEAELLNVEVDKSVPYIDLITISHEFTDHCHHDTLREINPNVPVFAADKAVELIKSWNHFSSVTNIIPFLKHVDWHTTSIPPLPKWLGVGRLTTEGNPLYYHSAIVICFEKSDSAGAAEAIIYTPHGVEADTFAAVTTAYPPVQTLAFMHGLHDVSLPLKQLNLGAHNALKAQKILKARFWVGTHDEVKKGTGFIGPLIRRKQHTIEDALAQAMKSGVKESIRETAKDVAWLEVGNGENLLLT